MSSDDSFPILPEAESAMKPHILQLNPILVPAINTELDALYTMHRLFEQADPEAYLAARGPTMRGVITGGHTGISRSMMEKLPALEVVAVNGVGTDAVDIELSLIHISSPRD